MNLFKNRTQAAPSQHSKNPSLFQDLLKIASPQPRTISQGSNLTPTGREIQHCIQSQRSQCTGQAIQIEIICLECRETSSPGKGCGKLRKHLSSCLVGVYRVFTLTTDKFKKDLLKFLLSDIIFCSSTCSGLFGIC
ncbi:hypothetical protein CEXT_752431 [Caerostris extrusa]|uniref:Uncharacterized protein n=1 Tax=Caerostris extrusa TaxID=172846 RepID=A0AAV4X675_CAEEX|nr:hypothetical protein CEXT_752431 [Caerostris extrusa]